MRAIAPVPTHDVKLIRPDGADVVVTLTSPPLGHSAMVERYYPPPQVNNTGTMVDDKYAVAEYRVLFSFVLLADILTGEDKPIAAKPAASALRPAWDAYARALRLEFETAGYCEGDVQALIRGYNEVSTGRGKTLGKPEAPSPANAGA